MRRFEFVFRGRPAALLAVVALFSLVFGCGGGGSGGGGSDPPPQVCVEYVGDGGTPAAMTVTTADGPGSVCGVAQVIVNVTDVDDVFGAGFDILYDPTVVRFAGTVDVSNSWLGNDGVTVSAQGSEPSGPGRVVVGISRLSSTAPGVNFTGTRELCRIRFNRVATAADSGRFDFDPDSVSLLDSSTPGQDIPGVTWTGGTFTVR